MPRTWRARVELARAAAYLLCVSVTLIDTVSEVWGRFGMTTFEDREKGYEAKFAHDADTEFRIIARRNRLIGLWAAARLGLDESESDAYARAVVQADFEEAGDGDVIRKLVGDLLAAGIEVSDEDIRERLAQTYTEARVQILAA
jgi:hypothetical protein